MKKTIFYFALFYVLSCLAIFAIFGIAYRVAVKEEIAKVAVHQKAVTSSKLGILNAIFNGIRSDLLFLADGYVLKSFLTSGTQEDKRVLQHNYQSFAHRKKRYDQIRLLDFEGNETIRIAFRNDRANKVPDELLQNKKDRYYFKEGIASDLINISPMDLNVEHGTIEKPLRPMIRFSITVSDLKGAQKGLLVLNYLGQRILISPFLNNTMMTAHL